MECHTSESCERLLQGTTCGENPTMPIGKQHSSAYWRILDHLFKITLLLGLFYVCLVETKERAEPHVCEMQKTSALTYSPANEALRYKIQAIWQDDDHSPFTQPPGPKLDELWDDLLTGQNIRVTQDELALQNENLTNRVQLVDGDYLGIMSVWHDLHCLDIMRRALRMDYYGTVITEEERHSGVFTPGHYDHCIERIRQSVMCHADVAVYVPEWVGDSHDLESKAIRSNAQTTCVDWTALDTWVRKRALEKRKFKLRAGPFEGKKAHHHG